MTHPSTSTADIATLALSFNPQVRFVPVRGLRRVIRKSREWDEFASTVPHEFGWPISKANLITILHLSELGIDDHDPATEFLLLPSPDDLLSPFTPFDLWRVLFHMAIDAAIDKHLRSADGAAEFQQRRRAFGATFWAEIRTVLESRHLITSADPDAIVYREFAAFLLELHYFTPAQVHDFFPGLARPEELIAELIHRTNAVETLTQLQPPDTTLPSEETHAPSAAVLNISPNNEYHPHGNDVKTAMLNVKSNVVLAQEAMASLAQRLHRALPNVAAEGVWNECLQQILTNLSDGGWTAERRLLYDIQRACLASEQQLFSADLVEWMVTFGQQPIKRALTKPRWLLIGRHLRTAANRAASLAPRVPFSKLEHLLHDALTYAEAQARQELRPVIADVLNEVGLQPQNQAETISQAKAVEELLDSAWQRSYLRIGDLRDALARSRIKLPDLSGPKEFIVGDPLIRANRLLAVRLDGVYHRGEVYMRMLQRACSLFFGTPLGRWLTLYLALPIGGAYVFIEAIHHMVEAIVGLGHFISGWNKTVAGFHMVAGGPAGYLLEHSHHGEHSFPWLSLTVTSCILFMLIHWPRFRKTVWEYGWFGLFKLPSAIARSPVVKLTFNNVLTRFYRRHFLIPSIPAVLVAFASWLLGYDSPHALLFGLAVGIFTMILIRTTLGRGIEDRFNEALARTWRVLSVNFALGVISFVLRIFNMILEGIDRSIYAVDEWLRFRQGQSSIVFVGKLLLGFVWFLFTYLFRFAWNLLVEPQINPIKHFPVVTVSHKLLLPLIPSLSKQFAVGEKTMGLIVSGIPGIFGFLVWELKENWKLYRANAAKSLRPAVVGSHGEKMRALLRPGFHSGVVPKTWAKLRKAVVAGNHQKAAKWHHHLHHIAEALHRLIEREFLAYLRLAPAFANHTLSADMPILATNRIRFPVQMNEGLLATISIEERGGWLIASVELPSAALSQQQRDLVECALVGLYKLAGVHVIREQAAHVYGPHAMDFDAITDGLLIPQPDGSIEFYDHHDGPEITKHDHRLNDVLMVYSEHEVLWEQWAETWQAISERRAVPAMLMRGWTLVDWPRDTANTTPPTPSPA